MNIYKVTGIVGYILEDDDWNFKWRDIRATWYKHVQRSFAVNRVPSHKEILELANECFNYLNSFHK